jgi:hypothetical protein
MSKYAQRLAQDEKSAKAGQITLAESHAKAEVTKKVADLESKAATLAAAYEAALGANPFNVDQVFKLVAEKEQNEKNLGLAKSILSSEFSA